MSSKSMINVNWGNVSSKYDSVFGTKTALGESRAPSVRGVYNWFVSGGCVARGNGEGGEEGGGTAR